MQIASTGDNSYEMSKPISRKIMKNIINLPSVEFAQGVVMVNLVKK